jgi:hypothetical protein
MPGRGGKEREARCRRAEAAAPRLDRERAIHYIPARFVPAVLHL